MYSGRHTECEAPVVGDNHSSEMNTYALSLRSQFMKDPQQAKGLLPHSTFKNVANKPSLSDESEKQV